MNCLPNISIALSLLALTAGVWFLYKTQKENLSILYKVAAWAIIIITLLNMACCGMRCCMSACMMRQNCYGMEQQCGMNMGNCGMGNGMCKMGGGMMMNKRVMICADDDDECEMGNECMGGGKCCDMPCCQMNGGKGCEMDGGGADDCCKKKGGDKCDMKMDTAVKKK